MKKKVITLLTVGAMLITMMAGCGKASDVASTANGSETTKKNDEEQSNNLSANTDEDTTLTVWCWDPVYNINALNIAAEIYQQSNPNFHLEVIETDAETIMTKLATSSTSGELDVLPDILLMDDSYFQRNVTSYPEVFLDITDYGFNYDEFSAGKVGMSVVDGRNYGIPFDSGTAIACYRTDILEEAGYTLDDFTDITWTEWIEKAKDVLAKTGCPLLNGLSSYNQLTIMLQSAGGSYFHEDGTVNIINNEILRKTVETYLEMVDTGVYVEETGWDTYIGGMNTGRIAGAINGCWIMSSIEAAEDQSGLWGITNIPRLDDVNGATNYSSQGGSSWAITVNCTNPKLAVDFFKSTFGASTELYDQILDTGAISTWLPAAESDKYEEPVEYFNNQPVFSMITSYTANVPRCYVGVYFQNANTSVANAITNIIYSGSNLDDELKSVEDTLMFEMEQ